jgi:hypothetical protein
VERAGSVFVPGRSSFFYRVVVIRVALILKHANKNRLGAIEWGPNDFDVWTMIAAVLVEYFCQCRHRKGAPVVLDNHRTRISAAECLTAQ